jgi:hypothetical protein
VTAGRRHVDEDGFPNGKDETQPGEGEHADANSLPNSVS